MRETREQRLTRAWGPTVAAKLLTRPQTPYTSPAYLCELKSSLAMTDRMVSRLVNYITGSRPPLVRWMPNRRA